VRRQDEERGLVTGIVSLGDPAAEGFADLVHRLRGNPLVRSVRGDREMLLRTAAERWYGGE
jgi:hypothetical protein